MEREAMSSAKFAHWRLLGAVIASGAWIFSYIIVLFTSATTGLVPTAFGLPSASLDGYVHVVALLGMLGGFGELHRLQASSDGWLESIAFWVAFSGDMLALIGLVLVILGTF